MNEARIFLTLSTIGRLVDIDYEILIVDDDSSDQTWSVAHRISLTNPKVRSFAERETTVWNVSDRWFTHASGDALACIDGFAA